MVHGAKDKSLILILKLQSQVSMWYWNESPSEFCVLSHAQAELEGGMYSKAIVTLEEALEIAESRFLYTPFP